VQLVHDLQYARIDELLQGIPEWLPLASIARRETTTFGVVNLVLVEVEELR
jgi:hypothetical protein